ncbi:FlgN protein [Fontibacillus phaseoli]|uniref:FlgN protein n=1 Tax=Fontibacillus phaseoli TaxID=1416533 RepID=A0A369BHC6_9BACL|nr:flagellar protein FlgN [Fontibacillus phaseoli]RCX19084.1 FlgN protein [Fontibacillus phaseoli]
MEVQVLIDGLLKMDGLHANLLEMMEQKKQAILNRNYEELMSTLSLESKMVKAIEECEKELLGVAQEFLYSKGIKSQLELTISEILRLVFDPEEKRILDEARKKLGNRLIELKQVNELNQELITQSLSFIDFSLNLMIGGEDDGPIYSPPTSQDRKPTHRSIFDTRA